MRIVAVMTSVIPPPPAIPANLYFHKTISKFAQVHKVSAKMGARIVDSCGSQLYSVCLKGLNLNFSQKKRTLKQVVAAVLQRNTGNKKLWQLSYQLHCF